MSGGRLHEKPLISLDPRARSKPSADVAGFSSAANLFIDEETDDLIAVYPNGEVHIFRIDLRSEQQAQQQQGWVGDTIHLVTGKDEVQIVKCCPLPNRLQTSFMVAVCHDEEEICFYLPPHVTNLSRTRAPSATNSVPSNSSSAVVCKPFAHHVCAPRNLRFRNRFYPIRSMWWMESRQHSQQQQSTSSAAAAAATQGQVSSAVARPGSQQRKYLLVMTQISVELLSVAEELYGNETNHVVLISRVSTRVDYWSFLASGQLRCAIAVNEAKPTVCKPFAIERHCVLTTMPQLYVEGLPCSTDGFVSPKSSSHMDCPRLQLQVQPVVLYDVLFILHVTSQRTVVLHRYVSEQHSQRRSGGGGVDAAVDVAPSPVERSPDNPPSGTVASSVLQGGSFEPYAVLSFGDVATAAMLSLEMLHFQVIDNLLLVHMTHSRQSVVYDIAAGPAGSDGPFTAGELISRAPSEANVGTDGNVTPNVNASMASAGHFSSFVSAQSAASQVRFQDPASGAATPRDRSASPSRPSPRGGNSWMNRLVSWTGVVATAGGLNSPRIRLIGPTTSFSLEGSRDALGISQPQANGVYASYEFYDGWLPMALDRQRGDVHLLLLDTEHLAARIADIPQRVQFMLNRRHCGPNAVTLLLRDLLLEQESLPSIAQSLDAVCSTNLRLAQARARRGLHRGQRRNWMKPPYVVVADRTPIVCGGNSPQLLLRSATDDRSRGLINAADVWGHVKGATKRTSLKSLITAQWDDAPRHNTDQMSLYRVVFGPLSQKAAAHQQNATEEPSDEEADAAPTQAERDCPSATNQAQSNKNKYNRSVCFANYILNALLEYTRSLMQHGETLADATQRCLVNMFLQQPQPDFFRLHQLLMYRAIDDHVPTALQLITLERRYPPALQMGLDMLARLNASNEIVQVLLARHTPLLAAKFVVSSRLEPQALSDILLCAALLHDQELAEQELRCKNGSMGMMLPSGAQYYTIFSLLATHFGDVMQSDSFAVFRDRYNTIANGTTS